MRVGVDQMEEGEAPLRPEDSAVATRPVQAPDAAAAVDDIIQLIANETEALRAGERRGMEVKRVEKAE